MLSNFFISFAWQRRRPELLLAALALVLDPYSTCVAASGTTATATTTPAWTGPLLLSLWFRHS